MTTAAANVELLCLDVDGVMTDGSINLDDHGVETKRFHVRDGTGIRVWTELGYHVALITGRQGQALLHRAHELGITRVIQGSRDKAAAVQTVLILWTLTVIFVRRRVGVGLMPMRSSMSL